MLRFVLVALCLSGCSTVTGGDRSVDLESGLVAHLPLDGDGRDLAGRNPAVVYGATPTVDRRGQAGHAFAFDGVDDYLAVLRPDGLNPNLQSESLTISVWARADGPTSSRLVQKWDENLRHPYPFSLHPHRGDLYSAVYDGETQHLVVTPNLWDGRWHHLVMTYDHRERTLAVYVDGRPGGSRRADIAQPTPNDAPVTIGGGTRHDRFFRGDVDDLRVYERALSASEVDRLAGL